MTHPATMQATHVVYNHFAKSIIIIVAAPIRHIDQCPILKWAMSFQMTFKSSFFVKTSTKL